MTMQVEQKIIKTFACLVIDDPLLRPRYGCLQYERLLQEMKEHRFFTEIAFIPWNYNRSDAKMVRLFLDNPDYYAICVHGCNHISNEFGGNDYQALSNLATTAMWRMEEHKRLTGLGYDPVMVFPQGRFSSTAMLALKDSGYAAAFNSTIQSTDINELSETEYQKPATTFYHGFPLFLRRYPKDRSLLIQDIASGRPVIIVEHPGAFKNGYKEIIDLVDWINGLGDIKWISLLYIANHYCGNQTATTRRNFSPSKETLFFRSKVALRRYFCEFRDNYVEPSDFLNNIYIKVRSIAR